MGTTLDRNYYRTRNYFRGTGRDSFLVRFLPYYRSRRFHSYCYLHTMHLLVRLVDQYNILLRTAVDLKVIYLVIWVLHLIVAITVREIIFVELDATHFSFDFFDIIVVVGFIVIVISIPCTCCWSDSWINIIFFCVLLLT